MMYQNISIPTQQRPPHADISNPHTAPAQLLPWLNYMATRTSGLRFSNGKAVAQYQMCTLNSKKTEDIIDYIPESPEDPGANAKDNVRTWYRDAVAAYNHDMQTLSTLTNALLENMGPNDATAIRALHPNDLTTRQIMQYLEEAYGTLGPSHLDYIVHNLLVWDPRLPARQTHSQSSTNRPGQREMAASIRRRNPETYPVQYNSTNTPTRPAAPPSRRYNVLLATSEGKTRRERRQDTGSS